MTRRMYTFIVAKHRYERAITAVARAELRRPHQRPPRKQVERYNHAHRALSAAAWALWWKDDVWM